MYSYQPSFLKKEEKNVSVAQWSLLPPFWKLYVFFLLSFFLSTSFLPLFIPFLSFNSFFFKKKVPMHFVVPHVQWPQQDHPLINPIVSLIAFVSLVLLPTTLSVRVMALRYLFSLSLSLLFLSYLFSSF